MIHDNNDPEYSQLPLLSAGDWISRNGKKSWEEVTTTYRYICKDCRIGGRPLLEVVDEWKENDIPAPDFVVKMFFEFKRFDWMENRKDLPNSRSFGLVVQTGESKWYVHDYKSNDTLQVWCSSPVDLLPWLHGKISTEELVEKYPEPVPPFSEILPTIVAAGVAVTLIGVLVFLVFKYFNPDW